jgi:hypothetical protein
MRAAHVSIVKSRWAVSDAIWILAFIQSRAVSLALELDFVAIFVAI